MFGSASCSGWWVVVRRYLRSPPGRLRPFQPIPATVVPPLLLLLITNPVSSYILPSTPTHRHAPLLFSSLHWCLPPPPFPWQQFSDMPEGRRFVQLYKSSDYPYTAVIDPFTGQKVCRPPLPHSPPPRTITSRVCVLSLLSSSASAADAADRRLHRGA